MANKAINSDRKKLRCAPLFASGYGWRWACPLTLRECAAGANSTDFSLGRQRTMSTDNQSTPPSTLPAEPKQKHAVPQEFKDTQKKYKWKSTLWSTIHYFLGILGVILGALVASPSAITNSAGGTEVLGTSIAIITAVTTFLSPGARAKKYNSARLVLHTARDAYEIENDQLQQALSKARALIEQE
jgi:hypothetical protein